MFGIPAEGWIALGIWFSIIIIPWTYSLYFIWKINNSGVERWGAKPKQIRNAKEKEIRV